MMEFRELKTFHVAATLLSFSKAAEALHYAQSSVSSQIKSLEHSLDTILFHRHGNRISLTKSGINLLMHTDKLMNIEKEIITKVGGAENPSGSLSVKSPQSVSAYILPDIVHDLISMFPHIDLDIDWCTHYSLREAFQSSITDAAFLITDSFSGPGLLQADLGPYPLVWIVHPDHPLSRKTEFTLTDLKDQSLLLPKADCSYVLNLRRALLKNQTEPSLKIEMNSISAVKSVIMSGKGISLVPKIAVQMEIESGSLLPLNWTEPDFAVRLFLIWKNESILPPSLETFISMVLSKFDVK